MKFGVIVGGPSKPPKERTLSELMSASSSSDDGGEGGDAEKVDEGDDGGDVSERYLQKLAEKTGVDDPKALVDLIKAVVESC